MSPPIEVLEAAKRGPADVAAVLRGPENKSRTDRIESAKSALDGLRKQEMSVQEKKNIIEGSRLVIQSAYDNAKTELSSPGTDAKLEDLEARKKTLQEEIAMISAAREKVLRLQREFESGVETVTNTGREVVSDVLNPSVTSTTALAVGGFVGFRFLGGIRRWVTDKIFGSKEKPGALRKVLRTIFGFLTGVGTAFAGAIGAKYLMNKVSDAFPNADDVRDGAMGWVKDMYNSANKSLGGYLPEWKDGTTAPNTNGSTPNEGEPGKPGGKGALTTAADIGKGIATGTVAQGKVIADGVKANYDVISTGAGAVKEAIDKGEYGQAVVETLKAGGALMWKNGEFALTLAGTTLTLPVAAIAKIIEWYETKEQPEDFWVVWGASGAAYIIGRAGLNAILYGKNPFPKTKKQALGGIAKMVGGPAAFLKDVTVNAANLTTKRGRRALVQKYAKGSVAYKFALGIYDRVRSVDTRSERGIRTTIERWKTLRMEASVIDSKSKGVLAVFTPADAAAAKAKHEAMAKQIQNGLLQMTDTPSDPQLAELRSKAGHDVHDFEGHMKEIFGEAAKPPDVENDGETTESEAEENTEETTETEQAQETQAESATESEALRKANERLAKANKQIDELTEQKAELQERLMREQGSGQMVQAEADSLRQDIVNIEDRIRAESDEAIGILEGKVSDLERQKAEQAKALEDAKQNGTASQQQIAELTNRLKKTEDDLKADKAEAEKKLQEKIDAQAAQIADLQKNGTAEQRATIGKLNEDLAATKEQLRAQQESQGKLAEEKTAAETAVTTLEKKVEEKAKEIQELKDKDISNKSEIEKLESELGTTKTELEAARGELAEELDAQSDAQTALKNEIAGLRQQLNSEVSNGETQSVVAEDLRVTIMKKDAELLAQMEAYGSKLSRLEAEAEAHAEAMGELQKKSEEALRKEREKTTAAETQVGKKDAVIAEREEKLLLAEKAVEQAKADAKAAKDEAMRLRSQLEKVEAENETLRTAPKETNRNSDGKTGGTTAVDSSPENPRGPASARGRGPDESGATKTNTPTSSGPAEGKVEVPAKRRPTARLPGISAAPSLDSADAGRLRSGKQQVGLSRADEKADPNARGEGDGKAEGGINVRR